MCKNILVVVAHPDDETIGMGGTISKHICNGDKVYVISMTNGVSSRDPERNEINLRITASEEASKILGFKWQKRFDFPDNKMDTIPLLEIVKEIEKIKLQVNPHIVYSHSLSDLNIDHRILTNAVLTTFRPQPKESCKEIRLFEVASASDYGHESITGKFSPNLYIDISNFWESKEKALIAYKEELREYPHTRSLYAIKNLSLSRGSQVGIKMAEVFQVIRKIEI